MFEGQPKGLFALALANTGERFGYYTMIAVFALFLRANFGLDAGWAGEIYSDFLMLVYFLPVIGGFMADKFGFGRMVTIGIFIMFLGYLLLAVPLGGNTVAMVVMLSGRHFLFIAHRHISCDIFLMPYHFYLCRASTFRTFRRLVRNHVPTFITFY